MQSCLCNLYIVSLEWFKKHGFLVMGNLIYMLAHQVLWIQIRTLNGHIYCIVTNFFKGKTEKQWDRRKNCEIRFLDLLHCWQKRCWTPFISTDGAFAWISQTLWRRWYVLASVISVLQSSTWQNSCVDPPPVNFLPDRVNALFFLLSSSTSSSSSSPPSADSVSFMLLFPSGLFISISLMVKEVGK